MSRPEPKWVKPGQLDEFPVPELLSMFDARFSPGSKIEIERGIIHVPFVILAHLFGGAMAQDDQRRMIESPNLLHVLVSVDIDSAFFWRCLVRGELFIELLQDFFP